MRAGVSNSLTGSDCGSGFLCGGKTGIGATGVCFRAARCLTIANPSDDVVTNVTAIGPPSESCEGACLDVAQYIWKTLDGSTPVLQLQATEDPSGAFISKELNSNGLPTKIVYGDTDSDPASGGAREVFLFYDSMFPGKLAEVRRKSSISTSTCSATTATGCARTTYSYTADGKLDLVTHIGFTTASNYHHETDYSYDTKGRITSIAGPLSGSSTSFTYYTSSDPQIDGFVENFNRALSGGWLTTTALAYDFWGNPTTLRDVDQTISCQTFSATRGYLTSRREAMAGQTSCATPNSADLETLWFRDSHQRLTKQQRPDGSCMLYEYDTKGRLARTKRRDDCNAASNGDREQYTYDAEGLVTKIETFDETNTVTRRREMTYFDSRRLEKILNPVNTSKWTGLAYDARGLLTELNGPGALSKTQWTIDADQRVTAEKRYRTASVFDTWELFYDWLGNQRLVTDDDHNAITSKRDDLGRVYEFSSADLGAFPTKQTWDAASRLTQVQEVSGGAGEQTHSFTFDLANRPLNDDYHGLCGSTNVPDIVRVYDALPFGISCPTGATCSNLAGRLAWVKTRLMCSTTYADGSLDQETFYGYDDAGRVAFEYIRDDTGRIASQSYEWTKNGALKRVGTPSGAAIGWTHDSSNSNSDKDRVAAVWRTSTATPIVDNVLWNSYGPLKQYNQMNMTSSPANPVRTRITRNLAYRITNVRVESTNGVQVQFETIRTEDDKGRTKSRVYAGAASGVQHSYFTYDMQDRLTCEVAVSGSSCTTGSIKNSHTASPPFTPSGDWKTLLRPIPGTAGGKTHQFSLNSGTHQISQVNQTDGTPVLGATTYLYDARGNRSSDDNATLTNDQRSYVYDARGNVVNVVLQLQQNGLPIGNVTSAFDARNRRVFKAYQDNVLGKTSHWFFYYDALDRVTEVHHVPDTSAPSTHSIFQLVWLGNRLLLYWQTDYPSATTTKRYVSTDETGRPVDMICWGPGSVDCPRVWAINPSAWGFDTLVNGASIYQPILFDGQYKDGETTALHNDGMTVHRPAVVLNGFRTYDPFSGAYLQPDPLSAHTWSTYVYVTSNPVDKTDRLGLAEGNGSGEEGEGSPNTTEGTPSEHLGWWLNQGFEMGSCQTCGWTPTLPGGGGPVPEYSCLEEQTCRNPPTGTPARQPTCDYYCQDPSDSGGDYDWCMCAVCKDKCGNKPLDDKCYNETNVGGYNCITRCLCGSANRDFNESCFTSIYRRDCTTVLGDSRIHTNTFSQ